MDNKEGGAGQATHPPSKKVWRKEPSDQEDKDRKPEPGKKKKPVNFLEVLIQQRKTK